AVAAAGCHKNVPQPAPAPPPPAAPAPPPPPPPPPTPAPAPTPPPAPRPPSEEEVFARKSLEELSRELTEVYFDFNESAVRDDARPSLQKDAGWLKRWPRTHIAVEGHTAELA